jgi:hypothetical protein
MHRYIPVLICGRYFTGYNTSAHENSWWYVHVFTEMTFKHGKGNKCAYLSRVLDGPFRDEIKPLVKYVKTGGIPTELFPTGGPGFTPVMTIFGHRASVADPQEVLASRACVFLCDLLSLSNRVAGACCAGLHESGAESGENKAQRAQEVTMKDVRKLELEVEMKDVRKLELEVDLAKIQSQTPVTTTTNAVTLSPPLSTEKANATAAAADEQPPPAPAPWLEQRFFATLFSSMRNTGAAAVSAASTPTRSNAPLEAKRRRKSSSGAKDTSAPSRGGGKQSLLNFNVQIRRDNSDE